MKNSASVLSLPDPEWFTRFLGQVPTTLFSSPTEIPLVLIASTLSSSRNLLDSEKTTLTLHIEEI